ncbi:MAG: phage shock protein operon transcriptional activator [Proteobacteria bacterium]|nr:phage shock protein operon transcriptional activator [Pseudomonadota bacterium]MBU1584488.1 phage shock protein operon transcriptional activator [Pseudomonadota bacterium]MBU2456059.1 phage shock protein operon transcriptional activator [Pseudomonadota bacterium]
MSSSSQDQGTNKNFSMPEALGQSDSFIEFQEQISKVAPIERPVLILGERGTGKELAASRIHFLSKRWQKSFVTLNCSALTPTLIGSELFGYEKGAFTGAGSRQEGRFEKASEGTLFLDEIGTIPMEVQEKILRVVEYGSFERVGSSRSVHVDVRIVAATNVDLFSMAQSGEFKQDLLDRLSFEVIYVPPLRHRKEDILVLANHFAGRMAFELGWEDIPRISPSALKRLEAYPWPGNIRELKNVIERAVYKSSAYTIKEVSFNPFIDPYEKKTPEQIELPEEKPGAADLSEESIVVNRILKKPFKAAMGEVERYLLSRALKQSRFNQKKAAHLLGLSYDQFRGIRKKHADSI